MGSFFPHRIRVKILPHGRQNPLPRHQRAGDAGMDLYSCGTHHLIAGQVVQVPLGICLEIPEGLMGMMRSRSGLAKANVTTFHGTIDSGYRGELIALMRYDPPPQDAAWHYVIEPGDRVAQIVFVPFVSAYLEEVDELSVSERGERGFGSTGISEAA